MYAQFSTFAFSVLLVDGKELLADYTLLALGITPNTDDLGLEEAGVELVQGTLCPRYAPLPQGLAGPPPSVETIIGVFMALARARGTDVPAPPLSHPLNRPLLQTAAPALRQRSVPHVCPDVCRAVLWQCMPDTPAIARTFAWGSGATIPFS